MFKKIKGWYVKDLSKRRREIYFIILISFLIVFALTRAYIWLSYIKFDGVFMKAFFIGDYHIHHFYYGVFLIIISSFVAIFTGGIKSARVSAFLLGAGLALFFDEIGLLLNEFQLDYYVTEHIVWIWGIIVALLLMALIFDKKWLNFLSKGEVPSFNKIKKNLNKNIKRKF